MQIKKRKYIESAKSPASNPQLKTVDMEANEQLSSNGSAPNKQLTAKTGGYEMNVVAKLRSAKKNKAEAQAPRKKDKLEGEVSFGPTETTEMKPERDSYLQRLKKRSLK